MLVDAREAIRLALDEAAKLCGTQGDEWDSDSVVTEKNYAKHCETLIQAFAANDDAIAAILAQLPGANPVFYAGHAAGYPPDADCYLIPIEEAVDYNPACVTALYEAPVIQVLGDERERAEF